jgi:hypothetical protein
MATAFIKIGVVVVKAMLKPLVAQIKIKAVKHPKFKWQIERYGQWHNKWETRISLRLQGHKALKIKPLEPEAAMALGSTVLGEGIIVGAAVGILLAELYRKAREDEIKSIAHALEEQKYDDELNARFESLQAQIQNLELSVQGMANIQVFKQLQSTEQEAPAVYTGTTGPGVGV